MKTIDFSHAGGMPFTQDRLDWMQQSYTEAIGAVGTCFGNKVILSGVEVVGSSVSDGWIVYNNELIRFVGGGVNSKVAINDTSTSFNYKDGISRVVNHEKTASCGVIGAFDFSDLKRIEPVRDYWCKYDVKEVDCPSGYITANFDSTGMGINERKGWAVCNGLNGTQNRGGRVSVGLNYPAVTVDPGDNVWDVVYNTITGTGGEKLHQLVVNEMPSHGHDIDAEKNGSDGSQNTYMLNTLNSDGTDKGLKSGKISAAGGDQAHENRMPFIVTLFIQKIV